MESHIISSGESSLGTGVSMIQEESSSTTMMPSEGMSPTLMFPSWSGSTWNILSTRPLGAAGGGGGGGGRGGGGGGGAGVYQ